MLSRANTQALRGFAAISIFIFHILLGYDITPVSYILSTHFVVLFLILGGYGLEESYRANGLDGFWMKRFGKVVLPFLFFVCAYNYLFSYFPSWGDASPGAAMHRCLDELLYIMPTFWFVFFVLKCYAVYWIGTRFLGERLRFVFFIACALVCLNTESPSGHLEAEQAFSFIAGVLISRNRRWVEALSERRRIGYGLLLLSVGAVFFCLKNFTPLHDLKGSIAYNYLLCPFWLSVGLSLIPLLSAVLLPLKSRLLAVSGKYSLEIYIAHIPFIDMIGDARGTGLFLAYSALAFVLLLVYRHFIEGKLGLAEALYILVGMLFVSKYSARASESLAPVLTLSAAVIYYVLLRYVHTLLYIWERAAWGRRIAWGFCLAGFAAMIAVQCAVDPYSIQVDRWSALHFPIENLLSGIYPYSAGTHLGGNASPFPVWQILHIPFYLLGNVGLSFFAAAALYVWSCWKVQGKAKALVVSLLLLFSVAVWYEAFVRSDLITNMLVLAAVINLVFPRLSQEWVEDRRWWIACAVALLACTRILVLVPIGLLLMSYFIKMNFRRQVATSLLAFAVFALTFVPFALWDWQEFYYFKNNPWSLQTRQGNPSDFLLFVPLAIFLALNHKGVEQRYHRNCALMLVLFVGITLFHNMYLGENWQLFSSAYDITYFSTALPFCLLAIVGKDKA